MLDGDESKDTLGGPVNDEESRLREDAEFLSTLDCDRCRDVFCASGKLVPEPAGRARWFRPTTLLGYPGGPILHVVVTKAVEFEWERWRAMQTTPQHCDGPYPRRSPRTTGERVDQYLSWFDRDVHGLRGLAEVCTVRTAYELEYAVATNSYLGWWQWEEAANESGGKSLCDLARRMMMMTIIECPARLETALAPVGPRRPPSQRHCTRQAVAALKLRRPRAVVCHGGDAWFWLREVLDSSVAGEEFRLEWSQAEGELPHGALYWNDPAGSVTRLAVIPLFMSKYAEVLTAVTVLHNVGYDIA